MNTIYCMLEIVFLFAVFCFGVVGVGVLSTKDIYENIRKMAKHKGIGVIVNHNVDGAAMDVKEGTVHIDPNAIAEENRETTKAVMDAAYKDPEILKQCGFENIYKNVKDELYNLKGRGCNDLKRYREILSEMIDDVTEQVGKNNLKRIFEHEYGHTRKIKDIKIGYKIKDMIYSGGEEVKAEVMRAFNYDGSLKELSCDLIQEYVIGFKNTIEYGGEKGYDTAKMTYEILTELYKDKKGAIKDIATGVNNMLDAGVYKKKGKHNIT